MQSYLDNVKFFLWRRAIHVIAKSTSHQKFHYRSDICYFEQTLLYHIPRSMVSRRVLSTSQRNCPLISLNDRNSNENVDGEANPAHTHHKIWHGSAEAVMKRHLWMRNVGGGNHEAGQWGFECWGQLLNFQIVMIRCDDYLSVCRFRQHDYPQNLIKIFKKLLSRL